VGARPASGHWLHGEAVQVEPMTPMLEMPGTQRPKLYCHVGSAWNQAPDT
jgi:hypothetical protein